MRAVIGGPFGSDAGCAAATYLKRSIPLNVILNRAQG
jgi:hypothetical protein